MNKDKIFILILVLWIIVIGGLIGFKQYTVATGTKIVLETMPVDPRDVLRGDFIDLRYKISEIKLNDVKTDIDLNKTSLNNGSRIYIKLKGNIPEIQNLNDLNSKNIGKSQVDTSSSNENELRGNVINNNFVIWSLMSKIKWTPAEVTRKKPKIMKSSQHNDLFIVIRGTVTYVDYQYRTIHVNYGIENYFIPEDTGKDIENLSGRGITVEVVIDRFGSAVIRRLFQDGKELEFK